MVGKIEKEHEERYRKLLSNIEGELVFSSEGKLYGNVAFADIYI